MNENDRLELQSLLDGELDAAEAQALRARLAGDPEAELLERDLSALNALLAEAPEVSAPDGLELRILASLPAPIDRQAQTQMIARIPRRSRPQWQGFALAASLLLAVVVGVGVWAPDEIDQRLAGQMTGTLVPQSELLGSAEFSWQDVDADVALLRSGDGYVLQVRADSEQSIEMYVFTLDAQLIADLVVSGEQRTVYPLAAAPGGVAIELVRGGQVVYSRSLEFEER